MKPSDIEAPLGLLTLAVGVLRGKPLPEARADAIAVMAAVGPVAAQVTPHLNEILAARKARQQAAHAPQKCPTANCVLTAGHRTATNPWCQDRYGTLFQEEIKP